MQGYFADDSAEKLCSLRGYPIGESPQYDLLKDLNIGLFEVSDNDLFKEYDTALGLYSQKGNLLLNGRYIWEFSIVDRLFSRYQKVYHISYTVLFQRGYVF